MDTPDIDIASEHGTPCSGFVGLNQTIVRLRELRPRHHRAGLDHGDLAQRAKFFGLYAAEVHSDTIVRTGDLPRLFTDEEMEVIAPEIPDLEGATIEARDVGRLLDLPRLWQDDIEALCLRRGLEVGRRADGTAIVSRAGVIWLGKLLEAERAIPPDPADWRPGRVLLPLLRSAMVTDVVEPSDLRRETALRPDVEAERRCEAWGIRCATEKSADEELMVRTTLMTDSYDVFRMLGAEAFELAGDPVPEEIGAEYRRRMALAYRAAPGLADELAEVPDRAEADDPEPAPVPSRRGRKPVPVS